MDNKDYRITLRFPSKKLKNEIKKSASKNGRSINAEIIQAIEQYVLNPYWRVYEQKETKTSKL